MDGCWGASANISSIRGCILWHVGWNDLEHVCYPAPGNFVGNIIAWEYNDAIEHSSSNCVVANNIIFGTGDNIGGGSRDVLFDGGGQLVNNFFYNRFDFIPYFGYPQTLSYINGNSLAVSNNVIVGPCAVVYGMDTNNNYNSAFYGNMVYANSTNYVAPVIYWYGDAGAAVFDHNNYYSVNAVTFNNALGKGFGTTFAQWQAFNPTFDVHSTASNAAVPLDKVYVIPNQDESKRCHIAVYNFSHKDNATVNLAGVLNPGDTYHLYSAQNYNAGAIQSGTYNGISISMPMTNLTTAPVLFGTNMNYRGVIITQPYPLSPEFGAFVVIGSPPQPLDPPSNLRVSP